LTPLVDGKVHRFETRGLYDGVSILWDEESGTIWHHLTGEGLYGPLTGKRLSPIKPLEQTTVAAALATDPDTRVALSERPILRETRWAPGREKPPELSALFRGTMAPEDTRRPTLDVGIGVWRNEATARYYPMQVVRAAGGFVLDTLGGRRILVYYDPATRALTALETSARSAAWEGNELLLGNERVARGVRYDARGKQLETRRPLQVFTRWYGWALSFPATSIYGAK
jgi:hypothetical protein